MGYKAPRVRVSGIVWRNDDQLLLVRQGSAHRSRWMLPGGGVNPGETMADALARELQEEIACSDAEILDPCALVESIAPVDHKSGRHVIHVIFRVHINDTQTIASGLVQAIDPAIQEIKWVSRAELRNMELHPPIVDYLLEEQPKNAFKHLGAMWAH